MSEIDQSTLQQLYIHNHNLFERVIKGGVWVFLLRILQQTFIFARITILARILSPRDFGLMGIAILSMSIIETFSQTGFQQALIRKKEDVESYLNSAWTIQVFRGIILFSILYIAAPYSAIFFKTPQATPVIRVIGLAILIQAFNNTAVVFFQKKLEFKKQFFYESSLTLIDFFVSISAVLLLKNVWAMVIGQIAGNFAKLFSSYLLHPYRPRLEINWEKIRELSLFGKWICGSNILLFLSTNLDNILVGRWLGTMSLGLYQFAYRISNMTTTEITNVISQVSFPAYSIIQDQSQRLKSGYLKVLRLTAFLAFPAAGIIIAAGPVLIGFLFGEKWLPMVSAMSILAISGAIRSIMATTGAIFHAVGKPHIVTKWQMIRCIILVCFIYLLATKHNILGVSWAVLISTIFPTIGFCNDVIKETGCTLKEFLKPLILPAINMFIIIFTIIQINTKIDCGLGYKFVLNLLAAILSTSLVFLFFVKNSGLRTHNFINILRSSFCDKESI